MLNEVYLGVVYRPDVGRGDGSGIESAGAGAARRARGWRADALDACEKLAQTLLASLARYEPEPLGAIPRRRMFGARRCSSTWDCWSTASGSACRCRAGPLNRALATTRLLFGTEAIEYRPPTRRA